MFYGISLRRAAALSLAVAGATFVLALATLRMLAERELSAVAASLSGSALAAAASAFIGILVAGVLYGTFANAWRGAGIVGATAAVSCCLLLDQLNREQLGKLGAILHQVIRTARRWPHRVEEWAVP